MFEQLNSKEVPKSAKEMQKAYNFNDFLNQELHCEKRPKKNCHIESCNLIDLTE
jgi:hypothetical protein